MCIIVYIPKDVPAPSKKTLEHCWEQNPDFGGLVYVKPGKVINRTVIKKYTDKDTYINRVLELRAKYIGSPFVLHMRVATHGKVTQDNCHPFRLDKEKVFAHNGTIRNCVPGLNDSRSDTRVFRDDILKELPDGWEDNDTILTLIEEYISGSRLAIIKSDGTVRLLNADKWEEHEGVYYSNNYYKRTRTKHHTGSACGYTSTYTGYDYTLQKCECCGKQRQKLTSTCLLILDTVNKKRAPYVRICNSCLHTWLEKSSIPMSTELYCANNNVCGQDITTAGKGWDALRFVIDLEAKTMTMYCEECVRKDSSISKMNVPGWAYASIFNFETNVLGSYSY